MFEAQGPFPEAGWDGVWVGTDPEYGMPFEVLAGLWSKSGAPTQEALKAAHKKRLDRRAVPLAVFAYDKNGNAWLYGPSTDAGVIELTQSQGQRLLQSALNEPDASSARTLLLRGRDALAEHGDAGVLLQGLFSDQQILRGLPKEAGWQAACERGAKVLAGNHRDIDLVRALGYQHKEIAGDALLLSLGGEPPRAVAILLRSSEAFDAAGARFSKSPIYHGLEIARRNNVPWLVVARGSEIRLYPTSPSVGVGRRGATQTYFGLDLALIDETKAGYLDLAFSANALAPNGSVDQILNDSKTYVAALSSRLRDRVYEDVVSRLSVAVAEKLRESGPLDADRLALAYRLTLKILFRLLFQAYAEDIRVLPFQRNERYTAASLKQLARHMSEEPSQADSPKSTSLFDGLVQVWRVIDHGDPDWGVPAYNGGLFGTDPSLHPDGAAIERLKLTNDILGPALRGLLVDASQDGTLGPVDFRSLDVRDFGTIYEGLLEAGLSIAENHLADDGKGGWKVVDSSESAIIKKTHPYFHTKAGDRKATGSYFTPSFMVEHLLEKALDPALDEHLSRVEKILVAQGDQVGAARAFFDFRVADLAMGSGHFLTAAISHIEQKFGGFLEKHAIPGVEKELIELRSAAVKALAEVGVVAEIDRSGLLSRQIAKRCVYGIDINEIAVELARLAIWVRTFVPGLPMSSLDHQLVWANSLTGIGTIEEALNLLTGDASGQVSFAQDPIREHLENARKMLEDAATLKESTSTEVRAARKKIDAAKKASEPAGLILDAAIALQLGMIKPPAMFNFDELLRDAGSVAVREALTLLRPAHFPVLFPEVFLRENPGFDVLVGNPPWEKAKVESHSWWSRYIPGLKAMELSKRDISIEDLVSRRPDLSALYDQEKHEKQLQRELLLRGPFPGIGNTDPDLYQAFSWRNWQLLVSNGRIGLVLPRGALSGSAQTLWRREILNHGQFEDVVFGTNTKQWMFENVHGQFTVAFTVIRKCQKDEISFSGPFHSRDEFIEGRSNPVKTTAREFSNWTPQAAFLMIPDQESADIYSVFQKSPGWYGAQDAAFRPFRELDTTLDRPIYSTKLSSDIDMPVIADATYNLWQPDFGTPLAVGSAAKIEEFLLRKQSGGINRTGSPFKGYAWSGADSLSTRRAKIVIRNRARATDSRTFIACLMPPNVAAVHLSGVLLRYLGNERDEAFLLGIVCSIPFDWQARRLIELNATFELIECLHVPWDGRASKRGRRLIVLASTLAAVDARYENWANAVGVDVGTTSEENVMKDAVAEIDALAALLFGLSRTQLTFVFQRFHRGWDATKPDYADRFERVMKYYDAWAVNS